jgi:hypothetical protein
MSGADLTRMRTGFGITQRTLAMPGFCVLLTVVLLANPRPPGAQPAQVPAFLDSGRELFVDDLLVEKLTGTARLKLHQPVAKEVVLTCDRPWEGNTCAYFTIFHDPHLSEATKARNAYRMYYRGHHYDVKTRKPAHREVTCYAESADGVRWTRPELGLFEFDGSKKNNIVWDGPGAHNFTPFRDTNPSCPPEARYKALASAKGRSAARIRATRPGDRA